MKLNFSFVLWSVRVTVCMNVHARVNVFVLSGLHVIVCLSPARQCMTVSFTFDQ